VHVVQVQPIILHSGVASRRILSRTYQCSDFSVPPEQLLEILNQPGVIEQTPARLPRYQQIEVAVLIGIAAGHGSEHPQAVGAALPGELQDFRPAVPLAMSPV
jgi:hypothetical protein